MYKMVKKYPPTIEDLKKRREKIPTSEIIFYKLLDSLSDKWYSWHSISWENMKDATSGETDFLIFHPEKGFIVVEVKGGIISVEDSIFYSTNSITGVKTKLDKDPFDQAKNSMYQILNFYVKVAKKEPDPDLLLKESRQGLYFPLNFDYMVFFPNTHFKEEFTYFQYENDHVFDESDLKRQQEWENGGKVGISPLEQQLITLLDKHEFYRVYKPDVKRFFIKFLGTNIRNYVSLQNYYQIREEELARINEVQDFLLDVLSEKKECFFKGSAGSGKTFIAMKKALMNYQHGIKTLFLCFNRELRDFIEQFLAKQLDLAPEQLKGNIDVYSINLFLSSLLLKGTFDIYTEKYLRKCLEQFKYAPISQKLQELKDTIPLSFKYDAILIDEAQDIDESFWNIFSIFFNHPEEAIFYVFFDEAQTIFRENFYPKKFGMNEKKDLLILNRNLRNTVQIASWIQSETHLGSYEAFSGIHGFDVTHVRVPSRQEALERAIKMIKNRFYSQAINPEKIIILSYHKLKTLYPACTSNKKADYYTSQVERDVIVIEPHSLFTIEENQHSKEIQGKNVIYFKTITAFKGLERDIIFLLIPTIEKFKKTNPERYDNFIKQIYVGASRAKFKLHVIEYD